MNKQRLAAITARLLFCFVLAVIATAIAGTIVQSHFNMRSLALLDVTVPLYERLLVTLHDLNAFLPMYGLIVAVAFALAFPVAAGLLGLVRRGRPLIFAAAGAVALACAFAVTDALAPVSTFISATRTLPGHVAMILTGALGGAFFAWLTKYIGQIESSERAPWWEGGATAAMVIAMGGMFLVSTSIEEKPAPASPLAYRIETVVDGLAHPWGIDFLPDGRLLVSERAGRLRLIDPGTGRIGEPLPGLADILAAGQGGLMDVRLSPRFERDARIYYTHTCGTPDANNTCLTRARLHDERLDASELLLEARPLKQSNVQYGSRLTFLPDDTLIMSIGDGFDYREHAQNPGNHFGKLVRLHLDGSIPQDNPLTDRADALPELYSYGHRNPQGLFHDPVRGVLFATEHGPRGGDEINIIEPGRDYGWPKTTHGINYPGDMITPFTELPGVVAPLHHWTPSIAPSGLTVYYGGLFPELEGDLLVSALSGMSVHRVRMRDDRILGVERLFTELGKRLRAVRVGPEGALYLLTDHDPGQILRVVPR